MRIEVRNNKTGKTRWISEDEAKKMGIQIPEGAKPKEGILPFLKSAAEATGIPKSLANVGAAITGVAGGLATKELDSRQKGLAEQTSGLYQQFLKETDPIKKAEIKRQMDMTHKGIEQVGREGLGAEQASQASMGLREYTGTTGSFQQGVGSGLGTLWQGGKEGTKAILTGVGLNKMGTMSTPAILKTVAGTTATSGALSKFTGGSFSEGAGAGFGGAPAVVATADILQKVAKAGIKKTATATKKMGEKLNIPSKIADKTTKLASESKHQVDWGTEVKENLWKKIESYTGADKEKLIKLLEKEPDGLKSMTDTLNIKRNIPWDPNAKTLAKVFYNMKRDVLREIIQLKEPKIAELDAVYSMLQNVPKSVVKLLPWAAGGSTWLKVLGMK